MNAKQLHPRQHHHVFGTDLHQEGERRTRWVVAITLVMMIIEIVAGMVFGSMALLADGWHMATHAAALGVTVFAYAYARKHATDPRYSFGTGKVGALGGFASAISLALVALAVTSESVSRLLSPVEIHFGEAIGVATVGLIVNVVCALLLREDHDHHHHGGGHHHHHHDHNLRGAYLHVMADALTSVLAILALVLGSQFGWIWMDPAMGVVGALIIARWSWSLLRSTSAVLLDAETSMERRAQVREAIESDADNRVVDLHLWRVGPNHLAAVVSVVSCGPKEPDYYRELLRDFSDIVHVTVEVNRHQEATGTSD